MSAHIHSSRWTYVAGCEACDDPKNGPAPNLSWSKFDAAAHQALRERETARDRTLARHSFDRGGWWTVLAWAAAVRPISLERIEDVRAARDALTAELKRRREAGYVERVGCSVDYRKGRHGRL